MYPNQGFPGQIPANNASQIPQVGFVAQPMPNYGQQQQIPNYNQPQPMNNFGQQQPIQPMANFSQQQPFPNQTQQMPNYGQQPQVNNFGQQQPFPNQAQQMPNFGQVPQTVTYPQISQQAPANYLNYGQTPVAGQQVFPMQQTIPQIASNNISQGTAQQVPPESKEIKKEDVKKYRPTVVPASNFNASDDAAILRKAMKGFGTNESALISVLCHRTFEQRVEIAKAFKTSYGKDLIADIRSETSGNFEKLLVSLCVSKLEFYCSELFRSMDGLGTDEDVLIDVMCTLSNKDIKEVTELFQKRYGKSLESFLRGDTSGYFKRLMTSLSAGNRDESTKTDINAAQQDARALKTAGVDKWGTDESEFIRILCSRNYEQIKLICQEYQKIAGNTLEHDIKKEFSGDIEEGLLAIVQYANSPPEFFARRLHKSMAGLGTNDRTLIRLCVGRCEIDMEDVKDAFLRLYGKTLKSFIKGDTSGDYKNALFALCGER